MTRSTNPPNPASSRGPWEISFLTALLTTAVWIACFNFPGIWMLTGIGEADKMFLDLQA